MSNHGDSVLITGCSSGLGEELAIVLRDRGWQVYASARRESDLTRLREQGLHPIQLALDSPHSVQAAAAEVTRSCGRLRALINNAGGYRLSAVEDLSPEACQAQFQTNLFGPLQLTRLLLPLFLRQRAGRIVFVGSLAAECGSPFSGAYSASKRALGAMCEALRRELRGTGVEVVELCLGRFDSALTANARKSFADASGVLGSVHAQSYQMLLNRLEQAAARVSPRRRARIIAEITAILERPRCCGKIVLPRTDLWRYLVHRWLPLGLQDRLLYWQYGRYRQFPYWTKRQPPE